MNEDLTRNDICIKYIKVTPEISSAIMLISFFENIDQNLLVENLIFEMFNSKFKEDIQSNTSNNFIQLNTEEINMPYSNNIKLKKLVSLSEEKHNQLSMMSIFYKCTPLNIISFLLIKRLKTNLLSILNKIELQLAEK